MCIRDSSSELELRVRRLTLAHLPRGVGPAEHVAVERDGLLDAARVELGPTERVWPAGGEAAHAQRLPRRDERSGGILEHGHAALVGDIERRRDNRAAAGLYLGGQILGVVGADVLNRTG